MRPSFDKKNTCVVPYPSSSFCGSAGSSKVKRSLAIAIVYHTLFIVVFLAMSYPNITSRLFLITHSSIAGNFRCEGRKLFTPQLPGSLGNNSSYI